MFIFSDLFLCACNVSMEVKAFQNLHSDMAIFLASFWRLNLKHPKMWFRNEILQKCCCFTSWKPQDLFIFWWPSNYFQLWRPFWFFDATASRGSRGGFHFGGLSTTLGRVCQSHADGFGFQHLRASGSTHMVTSVAFFWVKKSEIFEDLAGCVWMKYIVFKYKLLW